jgi:hypothetical protein
MAVIPSLSSFYSSFVNQEAKNSQQQYSGVGGSAQFSVDAGAGANVIKDAQSASVQDAREDAEITQENALAISELAKKGFTLTLGSFAASYKNEVMVGTDQNGDGTISLSELGKQVVAGGGTNAQAVAMYKAMDENGDGSVSARELEDSLPNPFDTADFVDQMKARVEQFQKKANPNGSVTVLPPESRPVSVDAGLVLGSLAMELDAGSRSSNASSGR